MFRLEPLTSDLLPNTYVSISICGTTQLLSVRCIFETTFWDRTDPYDEHSHVGPQLDGGDSDSIFGWVVTASGGPGIFFDRLLRRAESRL